MYDPRIAPSRSSRPQFRPGAARRAAVTIAAAAAALRGVAAVLPLLLGGGVAALVVVAPPAAGQAAASARTGGGYAGYGGTRWSTDYGISSGRCDRDAILVEAGGSSSRTLVQRHEENLKNRSVGIIGATGGSGLLLSTRLGGRLDERDRRCLGHVLELGTVGRQVGWSNSTTRQTYAVAVTEYNPSAAVPSGARPGTAERCRVLLLTTTGADQRGRGTTETLIACQANPGVWSIR